MFVCPFDHFVVCSSSLTDSDYPFGIFQLFYILELSNTNAINLER